MDTSAETDLEPTKTTFKSLPREIRDRVYNAVLVNIRNNAIGWSTRSPKFLDKSWLLFQMDKSRLLVEKEFPQDDKIDLTCSYILYVGVGRQCIKDSVPIFEEWALRSYIATEACNSFYANNVFQLDWSDLPALFDPASLVGLTTISPDEPFSPKPYEHRYLTRSMDPRLSIRDIVIMIDTNGPMYHGIDTSAPDYDPADYLGENGYYIRKSEILSFEDLSSTMCQLLDCPNLRRVLVRIQFRRGALREVATWVTLPAVLAISKACNALKDKIGLNLESKSKEPSTNHTYLDYPVGLNVAICQYDECNGHDVTWMWDVSDKQSKQNVMEDVPDKDLGESVMGVAARIERIRALVRQGDATDGWYRRCIRLVKLWRPLKDWKDWVKQSLTGPPEA